MKTSSSVLFIIWLPLLCQECIHMRQNRHMMLILLDIVSHCMLLMLGFQATGPGGILDCLHGRIRNQAVCCVRPVVSLWKTFPPWRQEEPAEGAAFDHKQGGY